MKRGATTTASRLLAVALSAVVLVAVAFAETIPDRPPVLYVPEDTGQGEWTGTYLYSCRDFKLALWIRVREGRPEIKARYLSLQAPETFETDWNGDASYYFSGLPGTFALHLEKLGDRVLEGTWKRELQHPTAGLREEGVFSIYRAGYGRAIVMKFDKLDRETRAGDKIRLTPLAPVVWTFWKFSKRSDALWEELPV